MVIFIKDMVCVRCIMAVQSVLDALHLEYDSVELGKAKLKQALNAHKREQLIAGLAYFQLELMNDRKEVLVDRIKTLLIEKLHSQDLNERFKFSVYLSITLDYDYTYLSNIFTEIEDTTIEKFYITQKIERVKELILYELRTITQITYDLNYSSVAHLCKQFKKVTGITPTEFKRNAESTEFVWRKV